MYIPFPYFQLEFLGIDVLFTKRSLYVNGVYKSIAEPRREAASKSKPYEEHRFTSI